MATNTYTFSGECRWAKVHKPDQKYNKYSIEVKLDEASVALYKQAGCMGRPSKDGAGYYTFRRDPNGKVWKDDKQVPAGPPLVIRPDGSTIQDLIGNGSKVTIKVVVYDYDNSFGKGKGTRLEAVCVDEMVAYEKEVKAPVTAETSNKPRIPW